MDVAVLYVVLLSVSFVGAIGLFKVFRSLNLS